MSRRHVFRVLAIYVAAGWGFTEIVQGVVEQVGGPQAIATFVTIAFIVGFPIVLFLAWVFDVSRDGVQRVPTRGKGQLVVSVAIAAVISISYGIYEYLPRDDATPAYEQPDDIVLAVLPFTNLSADESLAFMGRAIAEDLLNGVAVIPEVRVKGSTSSFMLDGEAPAVLAEKLGVNRLLDGTYRVQDGNVRINARLTDTATGDIVWTRVLTDSLSNIFVVQDQIARDIAGEFGVVHPWAARTTSRVVDPNVYQLYLQARASMVNPWADAETARARVRGILDMEPKFPEALMFMGFLDTGMAWVMEDRNSPWLKTGEEYTLRALEIDPELAEAYAVLALNYALQYRWTESRQMADRAINVAGARPLTIVYTFAYNNLGHKLRSLDIVERIFDENPLDPRAIQTIITSHVDTGQHDRALQFEQLANEQGVRFDRTYLIEAYAERGDMETANELGSLWAGMFGMDPTLGPNVVNAIVTGRDEALVGASMAQLEAGQLPLGQAIWNLSIAGADADVVFDLARKAMDAGQFNQIALMFRTTSRYRQDPRWLALYTDLGLVEYWKSVELPDFCASESIPGLCN